ncbi:MAG: alanine racemase [Defluviitaleaceae bacterium]|nr:alanine racemase [Defluviitaleaceae bacterium]
MSSNTTYEKFARAALVINLEHLAGNIKSVKKLIDPKTMIMAVVKADGYGHGILAVSRAALEAGAAWLGVATVKEGSTLREHGIDAPILVLSPVFEEEFEDLLRYGLTSTIFSLAACEKLSQTAQSLGKHAGIHIKIDTGMNRVGYNSFDTDTIVRELSVISQLPNIEVGGIYSHFATSDSDAASDLAFVKEQFSRFMNVLQTLEAAGLCIPIRHISNSGAILNHPECNLDMVRLGTTMYGFSPCSTPEGVAELRKSGIYPVLTLKSRVAHVKTVKKGESVGYARNYTAKYDIVVATVPIGYADGIARLHSNNGKVLINGHFCDIIGNVCMDQLMVDSTGSGAKLRDEVVFIGQSGDHRITAEDVALLRKTINYEVATTLSLRIPTYYID